MASWCGLTQDEVLNAWPDAHASEIPGETIEEAILDAEAEIRPLIRAHFDETAAATDPTIKLCVKILTAAAIYLSVWGINKFTPATAKNASDALRERVFGDPKNSPQDRTVGIFTKLLSGDGTLLFGSQNDYVSNWDQSVNPFSFGDAETWPGTNQTDANGNPRTF